MTRDDIIRMAREAGIDAESDTLCRYEGWVEPFTRFAALVTAAEREACAKVCEDIEEAYRRQESIRYPALRTDAETGSEECAAAIRAVSAPGAQYFRGLWKAIARTDDL